MRTALALTFVWFVHIRDYALTHAMIDRCGLESELNPLARALVGAFGSTSLLSFKMLALTLITVVVLFVRHDRSRLAMIALPTASLSSAALAAWWMFALHDPAAFLGLNSLA